MVKYQVYPLLSIFCIISAITIAGTYSGGNGDPNSPYQIGTSDDLHEMTTQPDDWDMHFVMIADVNMVDYVYTTALIAPDTDDMDWEYQGTKFTGTFNGSGYTISNITIDTADDRKYYLGLFGYVEGINSEVKNLGLESITIIGDDAHFTGGLCGENNGSTISNCHVTGSVTSGNFSHRLGGLCGYNVGTITNCYASSSVIVGRIGSDSQGSLCGENDGTISNCYTTGSVTGNAGLGGLCGENSGTISNCFATGSIDGNAFAGGLCGYNSDGTINNCYATGWVTGESSGSLCGENYGGTISNCYAIGSVTGRFSGSLCGDNDGGTISNCYFYLFNGPDNHLGSALDETQLTVTASFAGFDFADNPGDGTDDDWDIAVGHCPKLSWQTDDGPLPPDYRPLTTLNGSGHSFNPFRINNAAEFTEFITNNSLNCGYYRLTTDIDLTGQIFDIAVINRTFGGHFEGSSHIVCNITIDVAEDITSYHGFFRYISGSVSNLGIESITVMGEFDSWYLGSLCGWNYGIISNCYAIGSVTCNPDHAYSLGGMCGMNDGTINNCYANVSVTGGDYSSALGGLCGINSYFGIISNCYANGSVTGTTEFGGLCGKNYAGTIANCYFLNTAGPDNGLGIPLTDIQMKQQSSYAGWDFVDDSNGQEDNWRMCSDNVEYPKLWYQFTPGDIACPDDVELTDLKILVYNWLTDENDPNFYDNADLDYNGQIDCFDFSILSSNWLK